VLNPVVMKSDLLFSLRNTLRSETFVEVATPTLRRADLGPGRRLPVDHDGGRFLRAMIGPALRVNMEHHQRVFEIGPCFRPDKADELHAPEFQMLDLYAADEDFEFLMALAEKLIGPHIPYTPSGSPSPATSATSSASTCAVNPSVTWPHRWPRTWA
jgi:lysyl-tRNA synthetase class 2